MYLLVGVCSSTYHFVQFLFSVGFKACAFEGDSLFGGTQVAHVMELTDDLLPGPPAVGHSLGRPARHALVHCDGPPVLASLLGTPQGRWHAEFTSTARGARAAARLLCAASGVSVLSDATVDTPVALGMAVLLSWRFVHGEPGHEQSCAMMHAAQAAHPRRKGMKMLAHSVLHATPLPLHADHLALPEQWART